MFALQHCHAGNCFQPASGSALHDVFAHVCLQGTGHCSLAATEVKPCGLPSQITGA